MLLLTIILATAQANSVRAAESVPSIEDAVALLDGCSAPGACSFSCWDSAERVVEPAPSGSLRLTCYMEGRAHGPVVGWRESGRPEGVGFSKNGEPHGGFRSWHENGQRSAEGRWVNGRATGPLTTWHASGTRASTGHWVDGVQDGLVTHWHANGKVAEIGNWTQGKPDGPMFSWFESGAKSGHARFKEGEPHGRWREWHPNGRRSLVARYRRGEVLHMRCWEASGKPMICPRASTDKSSRPRSKPSQLQAP